MAQELQERMAPAIPFYYITDCFPNARVRIPELSEKYKDLLEKEEDGRLQQENPRTVDVTHHTKVTTEMIRQMEISFNARGEFMTDDPWLADKMFAGGKQLCRSTKFHPQSMKLPEQVPSGPRPETLQKLGLTKKSAKASSEKN